MVVVAAGLTHAAAHIDTNLPDLPTATDPPPPRTTRARRPPEQNKRQIFSIEVHEILPQRTANNSTTAGCTSIVVRAKLDVSICVSIVKNVEQEDLPILTTGRRQP